VNGYDQGLANRLSYAIKAEAKAIALADEVALLTHWLQYDILSVAGPEHAVRRDLLDFVVAELSAREADCPNRIRPVRTMLENQGENLLVQVSHISQGSSAYAFMPDSAASRRLEGCGPV
jgi:hypothetical protein